MERMKKNLSQTFSKILENSKGDDLKTFSKSIDRLSEAIKEYNANYKKFLILENKKFLYEAKKLKNA